MHIHRKFDFKVAEMDMTAMIDMVFQLIIFFMVLINFSQDDQNDKIKLPASELAKPAEAPLTYPIVLHLDSTATIYMGANIATVNSIAPLLNTEIQLLTSRNQTAKDANIVIRGHRNVPGGLVQDVIKKCQELGFEKFVLRVREEEK
ncbi:MAG: biopolymer transporter ExbD [Pirellula sp.]